MAEKTTTPPADPPETQSQTQTVTPPTDMRGVVLDLPKAPASPPEVLELKPNRQADAQSGPHPQISSSTYVHMTAPDGHEALVPLSNVENYERKGFKKGAEEQIEDLSAYHAEKAKASA